MAIGSELEEELAKQAELEEINALERMYNLPSPKEKKGKEVKDLKDKEFIEKLERAGHAARLAQLGAYAAGHPEVAEVLGDIGEVAHAGTLAEEGKPGAFRKAGSNIAGSTAGRIAQKKYGLGGGRAAALGGAVSGALQGEGVGGIAKTAASWYLLRAAFLALITLVGFIPALIYLDFHYIMSKLGSKLFGEMFFWQKIVLALVNMLAVVVVFLAITLLVAIPVAACNTTVGKAVSTLTWITTFGNVDICGMLKVTPPTVASRPATSAQVLPSEPADLVFLSDIIGYDSIKNDIDDRARQCMANKIVRLLQASQQRGLDWVVTSAFRPGAVTVRPDGTRVPSAHSRGEAIDIAFRPAPTKPWSTNQQIRDLVSLAKSVGFSPPNGDTLDEYNKPTEYATAAHIHIEFNRAGGQIYCDIT